MAAVKTVVNQEAAAQKFAENDIEVGQQFCWSPPNGR
jgi:hypothetical protein